MKQVFRIFLNQDLRIIYLLKKNYICLELYLEFKNYICHIIIVMFIDMIRI